MEPPETEAAVYALLADGTTIEIRPAQAADYAAVLGMHAAMSPENAYLRFFDSSPRIAEREAARVCREPDGDHAALLAWLGGELIGVASYERTRKPGVAEIAFAVTDHMHGRGVATLLLEHLVSRARSEDLVTFTAQALAANRAMLGVFADAGLPVQRRFEEGMIEFTVRLPAGETGRSLDSYLKALDLREARADIGSLRHLLLPGSVAVIGPSQRPGTSAQAILRNIRAGGFGGRLYAVNISAPGAPGVTCVPSVPGLPEPVDLAVVTVRQAGVLAVAGQCGRRGVQALIVTTSGLDSAQRAGLLAACRRHGMRLASPGSSGIAVPSIGLNATVAAVRPAPGQVGLVMQSGAPGRALVSELTKLGIGVSSFASVGGKCDVSGHDMLLWWEQDGLTRLAVLSIESFSNPRKFARTARRVAQTMPVLTVRPGRPAAGQREAAPRPAAARLRAGRQALFEQAGIIATGSLGELLETAALLVTQPVPAGPRVSVISNAGATGDLAAAACAAAGLLVHPPGPDTRRRLGEIMPPGGSVTGPVCTTASVTPGAFRRCLELAAADQGVAAVLAVVLPAAAAGDLTEAICTADVRVPIAAVVLDQQEPVRLLPVPPASAPAQAGRGTAHIPAYAQPQSAARALADAVRYGAWRARPPGSIPEFADLRPADAHALARRFLAGAPTGGWLPPAEVRELLGCYGLPRAAAGPAADSRQAANRAAAARGLVRTLKADQADGTEVIIDVVQEPVFGPLIVFRLGGVPATGPGAPVARITPLTGADADDLIQPVRSVPLLPGHRERPAPGARALRETVLRVSRLADDLPQVAELHLDPVVVCADGVLALHARVRLAPARPQDPFLRRLR